MHNCSHEQIELRAYQLWEERGRPQDTPEVDWFEAEAKLRDAEPRFSRVARQVGSVVGSVVGTMTAAKTSWSKSTVRFRLRWRPLPRPGSPAGY